MPQHNTPQLRFPEFSGAWEEKKIKDITSYVDYRGKTPQKSEFGIQLITAKNIKSGYIDYEISKEYILAEEYAEVMRRGKPKKGDVLLTTEAPLGNVAAIDNEDIALAQRVIKFRGNKGTLDNEFLKQVYLSPKFQEIIDSNSSGSTAKGIKGSVLHNLFIKIPTLPEQQKIASFLSAADKKLEQLQQKKTLLEQYKKGMMQKLFSQQIRFKDDDGKDFPEWEEKELGEMLIKYYLGGNYSNTDSKSKYPLIKMGNLGRGKINIDKLEYIPENEDIQDIHKIQYGDLFFNTRNTLDLVGKVAIWRNELPCAYFNSNLMYLKFENNFFMNYVFNSYNGIKKLRSLATGTTSVAAIYTKDLVQLKFSIPSLSEQTKIADFLTAIDAKIAAVSAQVDTAKAFKKGLLQQMFV